ncbi:hypothetical protein LY76DRAFT_608938 [Colletotrichum caudatum]|nr:hypothetical protein LY76DRAFT_608938 [Colletotrichum caudatum]
MPNKHVPPPPRFLSNCIIIALLLIPLHFFIRSSSRPPQTAPAIIHEQHQRQQQPTASHEISPREEAYLKICSSLRLLRNLTPDDPANAPMPLELLGLDYLDLARDAAYPGAPSYATVRQKVEDAAEKLRASVTIHSDDIRHSDPRAAAVWDASWAVADMLMDDDARSVFLREFRPKLDGGWLMRRKSVEELCGSIWMERGWL